MPLHEYINDPIARDIIHNGATFQVHQHLFPLFVCICFRGFGLEVSCWAVQ